MHYISVIWNDSPKDRENRIRGNSKLWNATYITILRLCFWNRIFYNLLVELESMVIQFLSLKRDSFLICCHVSQKPQKLRKSNCDGIMRNEVWCSIIDFNTLARNRLTERMSSLCCVNFICIRLSNLLPYMTTSIIYASWFTL